MTGRASANGGGVRLRGFGRQSRVPVERIVAILGVLPGFHLAGLREIEYDPERFGQKATRYFLAPRTYASLPNSRCAAEFLQDEERIAIYRFDSEPELVHVVYHEVGHHVCQRVIGGAARRRWVTELHPRTQPVSVVASRNAREDFAECYALYAQEPARLAGMPSKQAFMRDTVFRAHRPG